MGHYSLYTAVADPGFAPPPPFRLIFFFKAFLFIFYFIVLLVSPEVGLAGGRYPGRQGVCLGDGQNPIFFFFFFFFFFIGPALNKSLRVNDAKKNEGQNVSESSPSPIPPAVQAWRNLNFRPSLFTKPESATVHLHSNYNLE